VQAFRKYCLLNGFDDIGLTLRQSDKIKAFEAQRLATKPWLATRPGGQISKNGLSAYLISAEAAIKRKHHENRSSAG
jgi:hypothetical protein